MSADTTPVPGEPARCPAPWTLSGNGWIVLLRLPRGARARSDYVPEALRATLRTPVSALVCADYAVAPCGAYRELLFVPGTACFADGRRHATISRILVSTWASVVNGRENWGIPKELADVAIERRADSDRVRVHDAAGDLCRIEFDTPRGPRFPLRTRWVPRSWKTLAQCHEGRTFHYAPEARAAVRPTRVITWSFDPLRFPDLADATVLASLRVEAFEMEFPVARVA